MEDYEMVKKIIAVCAAAILVTAALAGCGCENSDAKETPTTSTSQSSKVVVSDPEGARVGTLNIFLNSRSFTLNEKVLHFLADDSQMQYVGMKIADETGLDAIEPGQTVKDVKYISDSGLVGYVTMKNDSEVATSYKGCKYYSVRLNKGTSTDVTLHLPNKITWNDSVDKVKKTYGEPLKESKTSNGNKLLKYGEDSKENKVGYTLQLVFSDKGLVEFTIEFHEVK